MFITQEVIAGLPFGPASVRLANLIHGGGLADASDAAYRDGLAALIRVGPLGGGPGMGKLVRVQFLQPARTGDSMRVGLRWEATGMTAALFPVLDADITLASAGDEASSLTLSGAYRPPFGRLGAGMDRAGLSRVANATVRGLLERIASEITDPVPAGAPGCPGHGPVRGGRPESMTEFAVQHVIDRRATF